MSRPFGLGLLLVLFAAPARAADPTTDATPEQLLSPTTQLYVRWDGVTAHAETYKKSFLGPLMAGPSGESLRALLDKVPKLLGSQLLAEPLLDGKPPAELKANLADLKNASKLIDLLADKGIVVGAEVREAKPTLKGLGRAFQGLLGGELPGADVLLPDVQIFVVVPDVGEKAEVLFAAMRLLTTSGEVKPEPFQVGGRKGFKLNLGPAIGGRAVPPVRALKPGGGIMVEEPPAPQPDEPFSPKAAWWTEGKHFVLYVGTMKPEEAVAEVAANPKAGGVTKHPLFQRCKQEQKFASVARGFADTGKVISMVKSLASPFVPGLRERIDDIGIGNLKAILFNCGYDGREFRAIWDIDLAGERKGFAKILKGGTPLSLADFPPMPPDVSRFLGARIDPGATYDAGIALIEAFDLANPVDPEDKRKTADRIRERREELVKDLDKLLGISVKDDLLPCLGDKVVIYQSPNEGLSILGTVVCVSLKDPAKAKAVADRIHGGIENILSAPVKVRKKLVKGVEVRELYSRNFGIVIPSYAIVDDWLVVSLYPQGVQGFILRSKGDLPKWKPDADVTARLAKLPKDGCTLQYCDPTTTVKNLCVLGPLFLGAIGLQAGGGDSNFDPLDIGLIPNGHELSKHLFPNLTVIRDDGKTVRIEVNESLSIPLEIIGIEPLTVGFAFLGLAF